METQHDNTASVDGLLVRGAGRNRATARLQAAGRLQEQARWAKVRFYLKQLVGQLLPLRLGPAQGRPDSTRLCASETTPSLMRERSAEEQSEVLHTTIMHVLLNPRCLRARCAGQPCYGSAAPNFNAPVFCLPRGVQLNELVAQHTNCVAHGVASVGRHQLSQSACATPGRGGWVRTCALAGAGRKKQARARRPCG